jgi:hypothetical protein
MQRFVRFCFHISLSAALGDLMRADISAAGIGWLTSDFLPTGRLKF